MSNAPSSNVQSLIDTKYFYINKAGEIAIDASAYRSAGDFSEGLAPALDSRKGWGFIDKTGAFVIPPKFESALGFKEGLAAVLFHNKWGFINKNGTLVIDHQFDWVGEFSEGVAIVQRSAKSAQSKALLSAVSPINQHSVMQAWNLLDDETDNGQRANDHAEFMVIDSTGQTLTTLDNKKSQIDLDYAKFSEGLLCAYSPERDAMGYINKTGGFAIKPKFAAVAPFSEGLARVAVLENGMEKLGFIDKKGDFVIPPRFNTDFDFKRNSSDFSEGLAALSEGLSPSGTKGETFIYIDKAGKTVIATEFFYAGQFRDGLAIVYSDITNRWGFIDKNGKVAIPLHYELADDFSEGLALVARSP